MSRRQTTRDNFEIVCDICGLWLYELGRSPGGGFDMVKTRRVDGVLQMTRQPIVVTIKQMRITCCSKKCVLEAVERFPEKQMRGGYPLN